MGSCGYYRILELREQCLPFRLGATGTLITVEQDQSYDFVLDLRMDQRLCQASAATTIQGIYEFLGSR